MPNSILIIMDLHSNNTAPGRLHVAIIGGGIAGLAAAAFLRKHPEFNITVYERQRADFKELSATLRLRNNGISIAKQLGITPVVCVSTGPQGRIVATGDRRRWGGFYTNSSDHYTLPPTFPL